MRSALPRTAPARGLAEAFRDALPADRVGDDPEELSLLSADIAGPAPRAADVLLRPRSEDEVQSLVRIAAAEGVALHPRGGGWSYTGGFAPSERGPAAIVDTGSLGGIALDRTAESVRVGGGVTWALLDAALAAEGLRVPSFGPLSGIGATVGGSVAQNGGFFGTAGHGAYADRTVLGARLVDGRGEVVTLTREERVDGARAPQPLAGDGGAFGIKTAVDLATVPRPAWAGFASFAFEDGEVALEALTALAGLPGLGEAFVFDPGTHRNLHGTGLSVLESAALAGDLLAARSEGSWWSRVGGLVRAARAKAFVGDLAWSLHVSIDGTPETVSAVQAEAGRRSGERGGEVIPDAIPRVTRAKPFRSIKALLGPAGELWLPAHGVFDRAAALSGLVAVQAVLTANAEEMERRAVRATILAVLMGERVVIEPQLFWPDALSPLHRRLVRPEQLSAFGSRPADLEARRLAHAVRADLVRALDEAGASHFGIGRTYAARPGVPAAARAAWEEWKARLDPGGMMNPGALGL